MAEEVISDKNTLPDKYHGSSHIVEGREPYKYYDTDKYDYLHDKIINLRFDRKKGKSITIRSDYEPVFRRDGTIYFKRCTEKPEIKVSYKHVSEQVAIEIDIEVKNFFIGDREQDGIELLESLNADPAQRCTLQIGYIGQFPDWSNPPNGWTLDDYYSLKSDSYVNLREIPIMILAAWPTSYPPDSTMHFQGVIGYVGSGLRWNPSYMELVRNYGNPALRAKGLSEVEEVIFNFIQRRFFSPSSGIAVLTGKNFNNKDELDAANGIYYEQEFTGENAKYVETEESGIMTVDSADKYGVKFTVSDTVKKIQTDLIYEPHLTEEENAKRAEAGALRSKSGFNREVDTLNGQIRAIQEYYPMLKVVTFSNGDLHFYHAKDSSDDIFRNAPINFGKTNPYPLPAIYDMTPEGTRVIRCPFIAFIHPFMLVQWRGRHTIGTFTSYFYPVKTNTFLVISVKVDFSTTNDENLMELTVVDRPKQRTKGDKDDTIRRDEALKDTSDRIRKFWSERQLPVVKHHKPEDNESNSRWSNIVNNKVIAKPENWPNGLPTEREKLEAVISWNQSKYNTWMQKPGGTSIENKVGIGKRTGIDVPWLHVGDIITIRDPYLPEYNMDDKIG